MKRVAYVLIAGDRGLAGGFNNNLFRAVTGYVHSKEGVEPIFFAIGRRTIAYLRKTGFRIVRTYHDVFEKLSYIMAGDICEKLTGMMSAGNDDRIDEAYVVYNEFATMLTQRPVIRKLLPVTVGEMLAKEHAEADAGESEDAAAAARKKDGDAVLDEIVLDEAPDDIFDVGDAEEQLMERQGEMEAERRTGPARPVYELLPDARTALDRLMARRMATEIYRGMLESYAAELAARMSAMDNAANNAEEMVSALTLELNRARQSGITMELLDIIGGSSALG